MICDGKKSVMNRINESHTKPVALFMIPQSCIFDVSFGFESE